MTDAWLLRDNVHAQLQAAALHNVALSADQQAELTALLGHSDLPRSLSIAGDTAEIRVVGVLTARPDPLAIRLGLGNTSYPDLIDALAVAASDNNVKRVSMLVDSPGGQVSGLFDALAAVEAFPKPIQVRAAQATSAAYALAAAAGPITAISPASEFGSIGVAAAIPRNDGVINISSTEAPNKRPDPATPEGQAVIREHLDAVHQLFAESIAKGRGTTVRNVNQSYGRGAVLLAGEAARRGMVDFLPGGAGVRTASTGNNSSASANSNGKVSKMNVEDFKLQHRDVFEAVLQIGRDDEFDRVEAHLTLGAASGDVKTAIDDIKKRVRVTAAVQSHHMAASMRRHEQGARQADADYAAAVTAGADRAMEGSGGDGASLMDRTAAALKAARGY